MHVKIAQGIHMAQDAAIMAAGAAAVYVVVKMLTKNRPEIAQAAATMSILNPEVLLVAVEMAEYLVPS